MKKTDAPIIIEQSFNIPIKMVWSAFTNLDEMVKWYFENIPEFKAEVGFVTKFDIVSGDRTFPHIWTITEVIPEKKIAYRWQYENYDGDSTVEFNLLEENENTNLKLMVKIHEDFSDQIPEFRRESCIGGWTYFIKDRLKTYLEFKKNKKKDDI